MSPSLWNAYKALVQLGFQPVMLNALYRLGLVTGHYRRIESRDQRLEAERETKLYGLCPLFTFPTSQELFTVLGESGKSALLAEADQIVAGQVRLFGGEPVDLNLSVPGNLEHWTSYETGHTDLRHLTFDIKLLWEPARFGWAFSLGRAFHLTRDEKYAETFWHYFEIFAAANPPYLGPNWVSGQEAALRLMAFVWAAQIFANSSAGTPERTAALARSVAFHALRIIPTFVYARSQQNNHLLTEAAGLLTAGLAIPEHPEASNWCLMGWKWLTEGLQSQIDPYGEYSQHSTNYHRLMLQIVLWTTALFRNNAGDNPRSNDFAEHPGGVSRYHWPRRTNEAVVRSIHWLLSILDYDSGRVPNLGANDGAYIFPLTICPFSDYRPVLNTAARAFLDYDLPRGPWDELALWSGVPLENRKYIQLPRYLGDQLYGKDSWAYLRTAQFTTRPSHADQLHVDLWWRSLNVTQDAGTYLYNADPPWDNSLTTALVHNTVTVNRRDQFTRAGRFLYLDWFSAYRRSNLDSDPAILQRVRGRHWGYWKQGVRHDRTVTAFADGHWQVRDGLLPLRVPWDKRPIAFRLHWLLPDWPWQAGLRGSLFEIRLKSPLGWIQLTLSTEPGMLNKESAISIVRAGETVYGSGSDEPVRGWSSPTYAHKVPALSLALEIKSPNDVQFISEFNFPI